MNPDHRPAWADYSPEEELEAEDFIKGSEPGCVGVGIFLLIALAAMFWIGLWFFVKPAFAQERVDNAVVFLADVSGSMKDDERRLIRAAHAGAIVSHEVLSAIRSGPYGRSAFAYVEFGDRANVVVGWTIIDDAASAESFAATIVEDRPGLGFMTGIGLALATAEELIRTMPFQPMFVTVDVAGDGENNTGVGTLVPRGMILAAGATINGMPMTRGSDSSRLSDWYTEWVIGGPRAFLIELNDVSEMPTAMRRKLILEIGGHPQTKERAG